MVDMVRAELLEDGPVSQEVLILAVLLDKGKISKDLFLQIRTAGDGSAVPGHTKDERRPDG